LGDNFSGKIALDTHRERKEVFSAPEDPQITPPSRTLGVDVEYDVIVIAQNGIDAESVANRSA
jgi:hypothetical protein